MFANSRISAVILVSRVNSVNPDISRNFCLAICIFFQISDSGSSQKTRVPGSCLRDPRFSRLGRTPTCEGQIDRRTDGQTHDDSIYPASIALRGKIGQH